MFAGDSFRVCSRLLVAGPLPPGIGLCRVLFEHAHLAAEVRAAHLLHAEDERRRASGHSRTQPRRVPLSDIHIPPLGIRKVAVRVEDQLLNEGVRSEVAPEAVGKFEQPAVRAFIGLESMSARCEAESYKHPYDVVVHQRDATLAFESWFDQGTDLGRGQSEPL